MYEEAIVLQDVHERLHDRPRVQTTVRACLDGAYLQLRHTARQLFDDRR